MNETCLRRRFRNREKVQISGVAVCRKFFPESGFKSGWEAEAGLAASGRRYPSEAISWRSETLANPPAEPGAYYQHCFDYYALDKPPFVKPEEVLELVRTIDECRSRAAELRPAAE